MQRKRPSLQHSSGTARSSGHPTRSDMARQRREQHPARRSSGKASAGRSSAGRSWLSRASVPQSPVLVRRGRPAPVENTALGKDAELRLSGRSRARRRYDIALNVPGAEIRLPSMPALAFSWRIASGALVLMMAAALYFLLYSPAFQVSTIEVTGLKRLTLEDINPVLALTGEAIVQVDPQIVVERLQQAFPEFSTIQVRISLPAQVRLFVIERQPVIDWVTKGQEQWVDVQGVAFPPRGQVEGLLKVDAEGSPLTASVEPPASADPKAANKNSAASVQARAQLLPMDLVSTILAMRRYLPDGSPLLYSSDHGLGWNDPGGWRVYFGSQLKDMDQKLLVYQALVNKIKQDGVKPTMISVEFLHAPYYRVEP